MGRKFSSNRRGKPHREIFVFRKFRIQHTPGFENIPSVNINDYK